MCCVISVAIKYKKVGKMKKIQIKQHYSVYVADQAIPHHTNEHPENPSIHLGSILHQSWFFWGRHSVYMMLRSMPIK